MEVQVWQGSARMPPTKGDVMDPAAQHDIVSPNTYGCTHEHYVRGRKRARERPEHLKAAATGVKGLVLILSCRLKEKEIWHRAISAWAWASASATQQIYKSQIQKPLITPHPTAIGS